MYQSSNDNKVLCSDQDLSKDYFDLDAHKDKEEVVLQMLADARLVSEKIRKTDAEITKTVQNLESFHDKMSVVQEKVSNIRKQSIEIQEHVQRFIDSKK